MENNSIEQHIVYHLNCGNVIVVRTEINEFFGTGFYPCKIIQNPQITPQGGLHVSTVLTPFTMFSKNNQFSVKTLENASFLWYNASDDLILMYEKVISGFKAKQSGIVIPTLGGGVIQ